MSKRKIIHLILIAFLIVSMILALCKVPFGEYVMGLVSIIYVPYSIYDSIRYVKSKTNKSVDDEQCQADLKDDTKN